jgi:hypothetical protein
MCSHEVSFEPAPLHAASAHLFVPRQDTVRFGGSHRSILAKLAPTWRPRASLQRASTRSAVNARFILMRSSDHFPGGLTTNLLSGRF